MDTSNTCNKNLAPSPPLRRLAFLISLTVCLLGYCAASLAQQRINAVEVPIQESKRIFLKVNPFTALQGPIPNTGEYRIGLEFVGTERITYQFNGSYLNKSILVGALLDDSLRNLISNFHFPGYRIQAQVRYFVVKMRGRQDLSDILSPTGIYVALHSSYATATWKQKDQNFPRQEWSNFTINGLIGMQLIADDNIGVDGFFGLGYKDNRAYLTDWNQRTTQMNLRQNFGPFLGNYLTSPVKVSLGFHFTFGLI